MYHDLLLIGSVQSSIPHGVATPVVRYGPRIHMQGYTTLDHPLISSANSFTCHEALIRISIFKDMEAHRWIGLVWLGYKRVGTA